MFMFGSCLLFAVHNMVVTSFHKLQKAFYRPVLLFCFLVLDYGLKLCCHERHFAIICPDPRRTRQYFYRNNDDNRFELCHAELSGGTSWQLLEWNLHFSDFSPSTKLGDKTLQFFV